MCSRPQHTWLLLHLCTTCSLELTPVHSTPVNARILLEYSTHASCPGCMMWAFLEAQFVFLAVYQVFARKYKLCSSDNRGGMKRRDKEIRKQPSGDPSSGGIPALQKIPGFSPQLGSPLGCLLISLSGHFIPPRLADLRAHSTPVGPTGRHLAPTGTNWHH